MSLHEPTCGKCWGDKHGEILESIDRYDWREVFKYAQEFAREDVAEVIGMADGDNDGPDWVGVFRLKDGRFAAVTAGCDYTGWG